MNPLESVKAELVAALEMRAEIDRKIQALRLSERALEPIYKSRPSFQMLAPEVIKDLGMTRAIEQILMSCPGKPLPPTSIRNGLVEAGFELTGENPLASIHQVLKRLVARDNSRFRSVEYQGQIMYKFDPLGLTDSLIQQFTEAPNVSNPWGTKPVPAPAVGPKKAPR